MLTLVTTVTKVTTIDLKKKKKKKKGIELESFYNVHGLYAWSY